MSSKKKYKKKEPVKRKPFELGFPPSEPQLDILDVFQKSDDNIFIEAVAGSGKSSTLAWLMSYRPDLVGAYIAFNKDIVVEMEPKCPELIEVRTRHSYGYRAVAKAIGKRLFIDKYKIKNILSEFGWELDDDDPTSFDRVNNMESAINQIRNNLVDIENAQSIKNLLDYYNLYVDEEDEFIAKLPKVFKMIIDQGTSGKLDFVDMKWLPVFQGMSIEKVKALYLDEYQDSSLLDMEFDKKLVGGRTIIVGDKYQSIYGFAGAKSNSIDLAKEEFSSQELSLHTSFRCSKAVTELAKTIVPHFSCPDWAQDGSVDRVDELDFTDMHPKAMILCRKNAPLVAPCFKAIRSGVPANIKGREIGFQLAKIARRCKAVSIKGFNDKLESHFNKERDKILNRKRPGQIALDILEDQRSILESFSKERDSYDDVVNDLLEIFSDSSKGLLFSSVHKSKGLEAEEVSIIDSKNIRLRFDGMTQEAQDQERNLEYVAITRAKNKLTLA